MTGSADQLSRLAAVKRRQAREVIQEPVLVRTRGSVLPGRR